MRVLSSIVSRLGYGENRTTVAISHALLIIASTAAGAA
jgi:hypothetical protein